LSEQRKRVRASGWLILPIWKWVAAVELSSSPSWDDPSLKGVEVKLRHLSTRLVPAAACLSIGGGALATSIVMASPAAANSPGMPCPGNVAESLVIQGCLPSTDAPPDSLDMRGPDQVPKLDGIPCTGSNTGTCIGLSRLPSADVTQPDTSVRHSP
jgi:hypothetical protein